MDDVFGTVRKMLTENTGKHILDSGGTYGRHWQRNKSRDFHNEPYGWWDIILNVPYPVVSLYSVLTEVFYDANLEDVTEDYEDFAESEDYKRKPHLECLYAFGDYNDWGHAVSDNTANRENVLDQDFQYVWWPDAEIIAIQSHNGADLRGGYSSPRFFECDHDLFDDLISRATSVNAVCTGNEPERPDPEPMNLPGVPPPEKGEPHAIDLWWDGIRVDDLQVIDGRVICPDEDCNGTLEVCP